MPNLSFSASPSKQFQLIGLFRIRFNEIILPPARFHPLVNWAYPLAVFKLFALSEPAHDILASLPIKFLLCLQKANCYLLSCSVFRVEKYSVKGAASIIIHSEVAEIAQ